MLKRHLMKYKWSIVFSMILVTLTVTAQLIQPQLLTHVLNDGIVNPMGDAGKVAKDSVKPHTTEIVCYLTNSVGDNCKGVVITDNVKNTYASEKASVDKTVKDAYTNEFISEVKSGTPQTAAIKAATAKAQATAKEAVTKVMENDKTKKEITAYAQKQYDDYLASKKDDRTSIVFSIGILLVAFAIIGLIAGVINTFISARVAQGIGADIRREAFIKIQNYSLGDVQRFSTSGIAVRLTNDIVQIQNLLMMSMQSIVRIPLLFTFSFIMALILVPEYWWIFVLFTVAVTLVLVLAMIYMVPFFGKIQKSLEYVNRLIKENFNGIRVVKSFVQEDKEISKVSKASNDLTRYTINVGIAFSLVVPLFFFIANLVSVGIFYFGVDILKADPTMSGNLMSVFTYLFMIMFALIIGGFLVMTLSRAMVSIQRINELLDVQESITYVENGVVPANGSIEFNNVSFSYEKAIGDVEVSRQQDNKKVVKADKEAEYDLENISFKIESGEVVGVVGATGSGKSTLVKLIPRLYDPTIGNISIGGVDLKDIGKKTLRERVAIVMQKAMLFSGDIKLNLQHGKKDADEIQMDYATQIAQAYEFIDRLDERYEAPVYERGNNFSGGQKQRLSMSRGFIKKPSIIILDDSTSALDARSEKLVKEAIDRQLTDSTVVIVAQKISSVINADKIIVMDEGKVSGVGTHRELLKFCQPYIEIYETQKGKGGHQ